MQDLRIRVFHDRAVIFESGVLMSLNFLIKKVKSESMAFVSCSCFLLSNVAWPAAAPRQHEREASKCLDCKTMENVGVELVQKTLITEITLQAIA